jgi:hypothetical protein
MALGLHRHVGVLQVSVLYRLVPFCTVLQMYLNTLSVARCLLVDDVYAYHDTGTP